MIQDSILRLEFLIDAVPHLFFQLEKGYVYKKPLPEKWSPIEIIGHLCDSALYNWQRFSSITWTSSPYEVKAYQQDALVKSNHYQESQPDTLLQLWVSLNRQILFLWEKFSDSALAKPIILPDASKSDLSFLIKDYLEHLEHHLQQIFSEPFPTTIPHTFSAPGIIEDPEILKVLFRKGYVSVECYHPRGEDRQQPHLQDEFYFISKGKASFNRDGNHTEVKAGYFLYVPAGQAHHFFNFSSDFTTWVVFF
jgi:hypothetical protein